jgi:predicted transcriptional regulator
MRNERKFKDVSLIFKNFNSWKILIFVFDAHESKKPISKNQLLQKLKCSYKTGNKYIDELVKKKILISFNKKNLNLKSNFSLRNLDYINQIDKRCNYYIPSLNIINDFKKFLDLKIIHYKKK